MPARVPLYLIAGDDDHLLRRAAERLLDQLRSDEPDLDVEIVEAAETPHLPEMRTASLFGGSRCVVLRGAESLAGGLRDEVLAYVEDPEPSSVLVLVSRGIDRRQRLVKRVEAVGERIDVRAPAPWAAREWEELARAELARLDRDADPAALKALLDHAGTDATTLASKCAQVAAATAPGGRVDAATVERVVEGHGNRGGFALADAIAERDPVAALVAARGSLEAGEAPLALLSAIAYRMRQLLQIRGGASSEDAGMSQGQHRRLTGIAGRFGPGELAWCHDRIARTDLELKSSPLPPGLVLEVAVIELATPREVGTPWNPLAVT